MTIRDELYAPLPGTARCLGGRKENLWASDVQSRGPFPRDNVNDRREDMLDDTPDDLDQGVLYRLGRRARSLSPSRRYTRKRSAEGGLENFRAKSGKWEVFRRLANESDRVDQRLIMNDDFQDAWLQKLREQLAMDGSLPADSWGARQRRRGAQTANVMKRPRPSSEFSAENAEAFIPTAKAYSQVLTRGEAIDVPVLLRNQGQYNWGEQRPIEHVLDSIPDSCTIDVQEPCNIEGRSSYKTVRIADVKKRFYGNKETDSPWNCLDMVSTGVPLLLPPVLQCKECDLLYGIQQRALESNSAKRASLNSGNKKGRAWKQVTNWVLMAEAGAMSEAHHENNGFNTWLTVAEGEVCFAWLSRPSQEDLESYRAGEAGNGAYRSSNAWRYVVLKKEETVIFESGLIHAVFRLSGNHRQTMMGGGHFLRRSQVRKWLRTFLEQIRYPQGSNEDLDLISKTLVDLGVKLVEQIGQDGSFGDEQACKEVNELKALIDGEWKVNFEKTGRRKQIHQ